MEMIHQAPYAEVIGIKEAKSAENNFYKLRINCWKNRFTGEPYKTLPGDVLILSDYRPEAIRDLQRIGRMWSFVSVRTTQDGDDGDFMLKVEASKEFDPTNWRNIPLFLIFLTNIMPNKRIWAALHMPGNSKILKQILCTKEVRILIFCFHYVFILKNMKSIYVSIHLLRRIYIFIPHERQYSFYGQKVKKFQ